MSGTPWDAFTLSARSVFMFAEKEARRFNHNYIGTEHILLGLLRVNDPIVAGSLRIQLNQARAAVNFIIGRGEGEIPSQIGLTKRMRRVIELAVDEARRLGSDSVDCAHLLLGIIREGSGIAAGVLTSLGQNLPALKARIEEQIVRSRLDEDPAER